MIDVLLDANLNVGVGEIVCLLGESGSGKTTLLNLLSGVLLPLNGVIERRNAVISYLLQDDLLLSFRTVWQNAFLAAELQESLSSTVFSEGKALLDLFRLRNFAERLPSELSGGMRRRVALVRQLLAPSNLLLLDEPFSAQDRSTRQVLEDVVHDKCRSSRKAAIVVTHDIDSAIALADRVVLLDSAKQLQETWRCPPAFCELKPSARRAQSGFADNAADVWRRFWELSGGEK